VIACCPRPSPSSEAEAGFGRRGLVSCVERPELRFNQVKRAVCLNRPRAGP